MPYQARATSDHKEDSVMQLGNTVLIAVPVPTSAQRDIILRRVAALAQTTGTNLDVSR